MPASPEQILCASDAIVVGTIVRGTSADCRVGSMSGGSCQPTDFVRLTIKVKNLIAQRSSGPASQQGRDVSYSVGQMLQLGAIVQNALPFRIGDKLVPMVHERFDDLIVTPATGRPLSDADVKKLFAGRTYIFAVSGTYASVWRMGRSNWITRTLSGGVWDCPKQVR
jgi:hypothetical protein